MRKKGLSAVITTLITILLVLVAIGIIWVVVRNIVETGTEDIGVSAKCLPVDVRVTSVSACSSTSCTVSLTRRAGGDAIAGVKLVFSNSTSGGASDVLDSPGNIQPLGTETRTITITGLTNDPDKVEVTPYFKDSSGNEQICSSTTSFSF